MNCPHQQIHRAKSTGYKSIWAKTLRTPDHYIDPDTNASASLWRGSDLGNRDGSGALAHQVAMPPRVGGAGEAAHSINSRVGK